MRGLAFGLAGGGLVVTTMSLVWSQSREAFLSPVFQWSLVVIYGVAMALALIKRPQLERMEAVRTALVTYLVISACFYLYTVLLYEVFDPSLYELQSKLMQENAERFGTAEPGAASEAAAERYSPAALKYTFGTVAYNYAIGALSGAAVAYLLGTVLGRKETATA